MKFPTITICGTLLAVALAAPAARAQVPQSYGSYYQDQVRKPGVGAPGANVNRYLYDKYFYHKQAVSPYQSLRRPTASGDSYHQYVRPEQQRREAFEQAGREYVQQRKLQGNVGHTDYGFARELRQGVHNPSAIPRTSPSTMPYYNQYYGRR
jgi:hypothetical protein